MLTLCTQRLGEPLDASAGIENGLNGFIVKNEPRQFAAQVLSVIKDTRLYEQLAHGASTSVREYTTQHMAEAVLGVYDQVLQRPIGYSLREPVGV